jgi:hypothetical protein
LAEQTSIVRAGDEPELIVRDMTGRVQAYTLQQVTNSIMPGASFGEVAYFMAYCTVLGANPFAGEVKAIKFSGKYQPVPTINFWERQAGEHPLFDGIQLSFLDEEGNVVQKWSKKLYAATATVYRKDRKFPTIHDVYMEEADKKQGNWSDPTQRAHMLGKVARMRALRSAFPPPVGLRASVAATALAAEALLLDEETIDTTAEREEEQGNPLDRFRAWSATAGLLPAEANRIRKDLGLASVKWSAMSQEDLEKVMDRHLLEFESAQADLAQAAEGQEPEEKEEEE